MSAASSPIAIRSAILKGIANAYKTYDSAAGESLEHAPEYFVTVRIADSLSKSAKPCWVTLESNVKAILHEARARKPGPYGKVARARGRFDIVLWYGRKDQPRAIVEVKHPLNIAVESKIDKDVERICWLLKRGKELGSSLKLGYFAFFSYAKAPKKLDGNATARIKRRLREIESRCKTIAKQYGCTAKLFNGRIRRPEDEAWTACTVVFRAR